MRKRARFVPTSGKQGTKLVRMRLGAYAERAAEYRHELANYQFALLGARTATGREAGEATLLEDVYLLSKYEPLAVC